MKAPAGVLEAWWGTALQGDSLSLRLTSWLSLGHAALTLCQLIFVCRAESSQLLQQP